MYSSTSVLKAADSPAKGLRNLKSISGCARDSGSEGSGLLLTRRARRDFLELLAEDHRKEIRNIYLTAVSTADTGQPFNGMNCNVSLHAERGHLSALKLTAF